MHYHLIYKSVPIDSEVHERPSFIHKIKMPVVTGKRFKAIFHPFIFVYHVEKKFRCPIEIERKSTSEKFSDTPTVW